MDTETILIVKMPNRSMKWCILGCGKQVICIKKGTHGRESIYECLSCGGQFTKKEMEELN